MNTDEILKLEEIARELEPSPKQRQTVRDGVVDYTEKFINEIETIPAFTEGRKASEVFLHSPISENPAPLNEVLSMLKTGLDMPALNPASGGALRIYPRWRYLLFSTR